MLIAPLIVFMPHGTPDIRIAVPILHRRPSRVLHDMPGLILESVQAQPDDEASTVILVGPKEDVEEVRTRFSLFDNAPRKARLAIRIESPLDHADWKGQIDMVNNAWWKGDDGATGVRLEIAPRLNDDNSCTVYLKARSADAKPISEVLRVGYGKEQTIAMEGYGIKPLKSRPKWLPRVVVRFVDALDASDLHP